MKNSLKTFSLRKLKVGVASVVVASLFVVAHTATADETTSATTTTTGTTSATTTTTGPASMDPTSGSQTAPTTKVEEQPQPTSEDIAKQVVDKAQKDKKTANPNAKKPGELIDIDITKAEKATVENTEGNKVVKTESTNITIKSTKVAESGAKVGATKTETAELLNKTQKDNNTNNLNERVVKATTVQIIQEEKLVQQIEGKSKGADIVFVIDHTGSMSDDIQGVKKNITTFVKGLNTQKIDTRLGLVDYEGYDDVNYAKFGNSRFTTDTSAFIKALDSIKISGYTESPTVPLTQITKLDDFDWSEDPEIGRFAILITDEDYDLNSHTPSVESTIKALKDAKINTTVVTESFLKDDFESLYKETNGIYININTDYAQTLNKDISSWVVKTVNKGRILEVTTESYDFIKETVTVNKPVVKAEVCEAGAKVLTAGNTGVEAKVYKAGVALPATGSNNGALLTLAGLTLAASTLTVRAYRRREN